MMLILVLLKPKNIRTFEPVVQYNTVTIHFDRPCRVEPVWCYLF